MTSRIAACTVAGSLALAALAGCAPAPGATVPAGQVVVLATATRHEPRPMLTTAALAELRAAADSPNASDGPAGRSSTALVSTADGQLSQVLPLTPRRANGAVEHGMQRQALIKRNLHQISETVAATAATQPGMDLLQGIDDAIAGADPGVLIIVSNGLSTDGGLDLRQVGWHAEPEQIVAQLRQRGLLPDLTGWRVLFTGLGATAGDQPPLPKPTRDKLTAYWTAICAATAKSCQVDDARLAATPPAATAAMPVVPIPDVTSVTGPHGEVTTTLSDRVLGFAGDSAALSPAAVELLGATAARITAKLSGHPDATVAIRGYTADPPGSTTAGRLQLSQQRAQAVAEALARAGVTHRIDVRGGGAAPGMTAVTGGGFDETRAMQMRRVEITY
ncbi:MAG TPA: OmpA family protein [Pseudonocardiaceae bacterium]|jgi:outer membrane protein OmpA-like peptidoglycan-associated protein|nr:OmpA family protein [Pseudonocardiaceae bacterium]